MAIESVERAEKNSGNNQRAVCRKYLVIRGNFILSRNEPPI
jgi:hypothetical protein